MDAEGVNTLVEDRPNPPKEIRDEICESIRK